MALRSCINIFCARKYVRKYVYTNPYIWRNIFIANNEKGLESGNLEMDRSHSMILKNLDNTAVVDYPFLTFNVKYNSGW